MDILEQHCTCAVCLDLFDSVVNLPRSLNCGHTFCNRCIEHLNENGTGLSVCPTCKCTQYVRTTTFPVNYQILGLAEDLRTKRQNNQRWSLRRPHKDGIVCVECSVPTMVSSLRVCTSCQSRSLLCPECAINNHNGHFFLSYQTFLATQKASDSLKELEQSCEKFKLQTLNLPFERVSNSIERLKVKCQTLSVPSSLYILATENPLEAFEQCDRLLQVVNSSSDIIAEKLLEIEILFEERFRSLSNNELPAGNVDACTPPIPPRRRFPPNMRKSINDRYSSVISLTTSTTSFIFVASYFPLFTTCILSISLVYFVIFPLYSSL